MKIRIKYIINKFLPDKLGIVLILSKIIEKEFSNSSYSIQKYVYYL